MNEAAIIKKIVSQLDKSTGEVVKEKPRFNDYKDLRLQLFLIL
jgi:hypothetical protein